MAKVGFREPSFALPPAESPEICAEQMDGVEPVSPGQDAEIDRRLRDYRENSENAIPAAEVHAQVDALILVIAVFATSRNPDSEP